MLFTSKLHQESCLIQQKRVINQIIKAKVATSDFDHFLGKTTFFMLLSLSKSYDFKIDSSRQTSETTTPASIKEFLKRCSIHVPNLECKNDEVRNLEQTLDPENTETTNNFNTKLRPQNNNIKQASAITSTITRENNGRKKLNNPYRNAHHYSQHRPIENLENRTSANDLTFYTTAKLTQKLVYTNLSEDNGNQIDKLEFTHSSDSHYWDEIRGGALHRPVLLRQKSEGAPRSGRVNNFGMFAKRSSSINKANKPKTGFFAKLKNKTKNVDTSQFLGKFNKY